jgi:flagellar hook-associated protein 3 FlgL
MLSEISTYTIHNDLRRSILELQKQLNESQREQFTGRHANLAESLGGGLDRDFSLGFRFDDLKAISETNKLATSRLDATQSSLASLTQSATNLRDALIASKNVSNTAALRSQADSALSSLISTLNVSDFGAFIFGGLNTAVAPIADYATTPPSPAKQAVDAAFLAAFGVSQASAGGASISAAQMQSFLSGSLANLFSGANWAANWSVASSQPIQSRISLSQTATTSVTANEPAFRELAAAYVMVSDTGLQNLNSGAYDAVLQNAVARLDAAIAGLKDLRGEMGVAQKNILDASDQIAAQNDLLQIHIGDLENIDPAAVSVRVNELMTQIQMAYSLTSKIANLSLVKYL